MERIVTYLGHAIRYCYACKRGAILERIVTYLGHAIPNCYACKRGATSERITINDFCTLIYCARVNARILCFYKDYIWICIISKIKRIIVFVVFKRGTTRERIVTYRGHAIWYCYACKRFATIERFSTYRGYAIGYCYACKRGAKPECTGTYRGHSLAVVG